MYRSLRRGLGVLDLNKRNPRSHVGGRDRAGTVNGKYVCELFVSYGGEQNALRQKLGGQSLFPGTKTNQATIGTSTLDYNHTTHQRKRVSIATAMAARQPR
jgi:hypothetical protein